MDGTVAVTDFDHNDAGNLGAAVLSNQDPLSGLDAPGREVAAAGIRTVNGEVVDDRPFTPYRVPNQNLLITPEILNENMVDVTVTPTRPGLPATVDWRPQTRAFVVAAPGPVGQCWLGAGPTDASFWLPPSEATREPPAGDSAGDVPGRSYSSGDGRGRLNTADANDGRRRSGGRRAARSVGQSRRFLGGPSFQRGSSGERRGTRGP